MAAGRRDLGLGASTDAEKEEHANMTSAYPRLRGSCLCGAATYDVADTFDYCLICHCSQCRRATGSASKPFAGIAADRIEVRGEVDRYGDAVVHDVRCRRCGSLLYSLVREGRYVHVTLGTLIDDPTIRPSAHIFVGSKAPWDVICDGLPCFDAFPAS